MMISHFNMSLPTYYKRSGYEFQVVKSSGDISRAIGKKGKFVIHQVTHLLRDPDTGGELEKAWNYDNEAQAIDKFNALAS